MTKRNRKTKYYGEYLEFNGERLRINSGEGKGVYLEIIHGIINQLDIAYSIHKRVLVIVFEVHQREYKKDNSDLSNLIKNTKQWIARNYKMKSIGHVWVREMERAKTQHYHGALFLDGDKIRTSYKVFNKMRDLWGDRGHMPHLENPYYFIDKNNHDEVRADAIYRLSYFAKTRGKGYRDQQTKDYSLSRLNLQDASPDQSVMQYT